MLGAPGSTCVLLYGCPMEGEFLQEPSSLGCVLLINQLISALNGRDLGVGGGSTRTTLS